MGVVVVDVVDAVLVLVDIDEVGYGWDLGWFYHHWRGCCCYYYS